MHDYVKMKPEFIKIWVDDRGGTKKTLTPPLYRAILDEAHKFNVPVGVHNVKLADAKELMRGGMEGWLHVPVRGGEVVDDELIGIVKDRIARNDRPIMWMTPVADHGVDEHAGRRRRARPGSTIRCCAQTYSPAQIEQYWGEPLKQDDAANGRARQRVSSGRRATR